MVVSFLLFQRSSFELSRDISWNEHKSRGYILRDPNNSDELLYLTPSEYNKLVRVMLSNEISVEVIATPKDTPETIDKRFPAPSSKTPKRAVLREFLFNSNPLWRVSGSTIDIRGNPYSFLPTYCNHIVSWLNLRPSRFFLKSIRKLGKRFGDIFKNNGVNSYILRQKVCAIVVLKYLGGEKLKTTQSLGVRIRLVNGLPQYLPYPIRYFIRSRSTAYIRLILSLLYSYKGIKGDYKDVSLASIVAPKFIASSSLLDETSLLIPKFFKEFNPKNILPSIDFTIKEPPFIVSAGPNSPVSFLGSGLDGIAHLTLGDNSPLIKYLQSLDKYFPDLGIGDKLITLMDDVAYKQEYNNIKDILFKIDKYALPKGLISKISQTPIYSQSLSELSLGKLSLKFEAAGKIRVFAISDYWSQWVLKPIHKSIFKILRDHPCDATFDQLGKVENFASQRYRYIASFDLKSATDLIPQQLYLLVFQYWFSLINAKDLAFDWMSVLVNRYYKITIPYKYTFKPNDSIYDIVPYEGPRDIPNHVTLRVKYTRGQPMGALSSWASLAMVHHFLVFLAASRVGQFSFRDYLVLGDDIVIANRMVATSYLEVCSQWGITVGLPKSFESDEGLFQFASQDMLGETNLSPISLREVLAVNYQDETNFNKKGITSLYNRVEFIQRLIWKGFLDRDNIMSHLRAMFSPRDWKIISRDIRAGKIPTMVIPALILLLTSPQGRVSNNYNLVRLMALLRGDIVGLTVDRVYPISEQQMFLSALIEGISDLIDKEIEILCPKLSGMVRQESWLTYTQFSELYESHINHRVPRELIDLSFLEDEYKELSEKLLSNIHENVYHYLIQGSETMVHILTLTDFERLSQILLEIRRFKVSTDFDRSISHPSSYRNLRKVKTLMALNPSWNRSQTRTTMPRLQSL